MNNSKVCGQFKKYAPRPSLDSEAKELQKWGRGQQLLETGWSLPRPESRGPCVLRSARAGP
eukprot:15423539-Alexandrium_andersonii.AAC.1